MGSLSSVLLHNWTFEPSNQHWFCCFKLSHCAYINIGLCRINIAPFICVCVGVCWSTRLEKLCMLYIFQIKTFQIQHT
jgi:hypothetical protein